MRLRWLLWSIRYWHGNRVRVHARCGSYYHLLGLLSFVEFLRRRGVVVDDVEVCYIGFLGKTQLESLLGSAELIGVRFRAEEPPLPNDAPPGPRFSLRALWSWHRAAVICCSPGKLGPAVVAAASARMPGVRLYWCRLEEGTGSYSDLRARRASRIREEGRAAGAWHRVLATLLLDWFYSWVFGRVPWLLFGNLGPWTWSRPLIVDAYRTAVVRYADSILSVLPEVAPGTVLFLSQPVVELGVCSRKEYLSYIGAARRILAPDVPFRVKAHPSEDVGKFPASWVLHTDLPAEVLCARLSGRISCVAGLNSTSLYAVPVLNGVPSVVCDAAVVHDFIDSAGATAKRILRKSAYRWLVIDGDEGAS